MISADLVAGATTFKTANFTTSLIPIHLHPCPKKHLINLLGRVSANLELIVGKKLRESVLSNIVPKKCHLKQGGLIRDLNFFVNLVQNVPLGHLELVHTSMKMKLLPLNFNRSLSFNHNHNLKFNLH